MNDWQDRSELIKKLKQHKTDNERILNLESNMRQHKALIEKTLQKLEVS